MKVTCLTEDVFSAGAKVDRDKGIIFGVKALAPESRNGRTYAPRALSDAERLYEGIGVNINHPDKATGNRDFEAGIGWLTSAIAKGDGVYADLHYLKEHPCAAMLVESAERNPTRFGLSHNADGDEQLRNGKRIVESLATVRSVDIVQNPATTRGLFESTTGKRVTIREVFAPFPELTQLLEDDALLPAEETVPADAGADPHAGVKAAIVALITAAIENTEGDESTMLATIGKIIAARQAVIDGLPADEEDPEEEEDDDELDPEAEAAKTPADPLKKKVKPMAESTKATADPAVKALLESTNALLVEMKADRAAEKAERTAKEVRESCKSLLESMGRDPAEVRIVALSKLDKDEDRKALVESWAEKPTRFSKRPERSAPLLESNGRYPETVSDFAASIKI